MALYLTFVLAFLAFVTFTATRMLLSLFALHLGASPFAVGVIGALFWIFPMLLSWPIGAASDRFGSRWLLVAGSLAGVGGLLVPGFFDSVEAAYAAATLGGLSLSVYNVAMQNIVGQISAPEHRTRNFANFMVIGSLSSFVGPLVTGFFIDHVGYSSASLILVVVPLLGLILLLARGSLLPRGSPPPPGSGQKRAAASLSGPHMRSTLLLGAAVTLGTDMFQFYLPVYGHQLGMTASVIGVMTGCLSVASFVARLFIGRLISIMGEERLLTVTMLLGALAYLLVPFAGSALTLGAISVLFGLSMGCGQPLTVMLAYSLAEAGRAGETLGLRLTVNNLARVIGPLFFGFVATAFGMLPMFWLNGLLLGGSGLISRGRERPAHGKESE